MSEIVDKWFEFGDNDLKNAEILFENKAYEGSIWHCHQALEKYFKGVIVKLDKSVRRTHDLPTLLNDTGFDFPSDILDFTHELNAYYQPSRYPDTALLNKLSYERATANRFLKMTKTIIKWLKFQIQQKK